MRAWSTSRHPVALPSGHRFPATKYALVREAVVARGLLPLDAIVEPSPVERWMLSLVHHDAWIDGVLDGTLTTSEQRRLGLPWTESLRERSLRSVQATLEASRDALACGLGIHLGGGTHHAFATYGEGFCVFNDVAVTVRVLQREGAIQRAVIVDLDVHQGNGTAHLFAGDPDVFTFSMHGERNFPFRKEPSTLDVGLADRCDDDAYLAALDQHLERVLDDSRADLAIYLAGADPYLHDRFGRLGLTMEGLRARDQRVARAVRRRGLPLVMTMSGGYAKDLADVASIHASTVQELLAYAPRSEVSPCSPDG